jgi:hypothetical protein
MNLKLPFRTFACCKISLDKICGKYRWQVSQVGWKVCSHTEGVINSCALSLMGCIRIVGRKKVLVDTPC